MKKIRAEFLLLTVILCFLAFLGGFHLGSQRRGKEITIHTTKNETAAVIETEQVSEKDLPLETGSSEAGLVNINTATLDELCTLPGIGEVIAQRIIDYREAHDGFSSVDELDEVSGIGSKRLEAILDYITVEEDYENTGR